MTCYVLLINRKMTVITRKEAKIKIDIDSLIKVTNSYANNSVIGYLIKS